MITVEHYLSSRNYAKTSLKQRSLILGAFVRHVGDPVACSAEDVFDWWATTADQAPWSRRAKLSATRSFLDWLVEAGLRADNPCRLIATPKIPKMVPKVLTAAEVVALRRAVKTPGEHLLIELMLTLGLRRSEVAALRAESLDRDAELLTVVGKSGAAMIPVPSWMVDLWPTEGSVLGLSDRQVGDHTKRIMARAGITGHTCHSLRRTCGTLLAQRAPLSVVAQLLRHESVQTTARHYVATSMEDLRKAVQ